MVLVGFLATHLAEGKLRAALYARVSTRVSTHDSTHDEQMLPLQSRGMREYAARQGWSIVYR